MNIQEVRTNCQKGRALMARCRMDHFAVGAFNVDNQETLIAICNAAKKLNSPVLVEVSYDESISIGLNNIRDMVNNYKREMGLEIYINLDHSPSVEAAIKGIDTGFEFIHIDISQANHNATPGQIIESTRKVVEYAKKTGALVESELHYFGGSSNVHTEYIDYKEIKKTFSTPEATKTFVDATGIDTFAVAIGNLHGRYPVPKQLDLVLLKQIKAAVNCNLSLHGGSGTPLKLFEEAIKIGIIKVNINSDLRYTFRTTFEKVLEENPSEFAIIKIIKPVIDAVQSIVEEKILAFGSANKAQV